jgi:hypothetical protein
VVTTNGLRVFPAYDFVSKGNQLLKDTDGTDADFFEKRNIQVC